MFFLWFWNLGSCDDFKMLGRLCSDVRYCSPHGTRTDVWNQSLGTSTILDQDRFLIPVLVFPSKLLVWLEGHRFVIDLSSFSGFTFFFWGVFGSKFLPWLDLSSWNYCWCFRGLHMPACSDLVDRVKMLHGKWKVMIWDFRSWNHNSCHWHVLYYIYLRESRQGCQYFWARIGLSCLPYIWDFSIVWTT